MAMMALLIGILVATPVYDITVVRATPAWTGLGLALQAAVTEVLWMRALLFRLLWRASDPWRPSSPPRWASAPCTSPTPEPPRSPVPPWSWPD